MKLFLFLRRNNMRRTLAVTGLGLLSGLASGLVLAVVNSAMHGQGSGWRSHVLMAFVIVAVIRIVASVASGLLLVRVTLDATLGLCTDLCRKIATTPFRILEEIGPARILTCLTEDVYVLGSAIQAIPTLLVNIATLAGCALYLAWASWEAAVVLTLVVAAAAFCHRLLLRRAYTAVEKVRSGRDIMFRHFRSLTEGIKELKTHGRRREAFLREDIEGSAQYLREHNLIAMNRYALADGWSQTVFYCLLAVLLFALPRWNQIPVQTLTAYVFGALYMMGPVWGIIGAIPTFNRGHASLDRLDHLGWSLEDDKETTFEAGIQRHTTPPLVEFHAVAFTYSAKSGNSGFSLGPVDMVLHPGELTLVIGGNGSGKSTFVKLLTGLYTPGDGEILVNGTPVSPASREAYRQLFSVVYSDFYLFDRLLGLNDGEVDAHAGRYLHALDLEHKVRLHDKSFSTTTLSQGQRRRLALLSAYLEDRPIYVLDEWAADQDPSFRRVFYLELLPELKKRGKTIVVITHDDRYFHLGDQVVKLDYGKVVETTRAPVSAYQSGT